MGKTRFRRLEYLYLTALGCIALSIIVSQLVIQRAIESQQDDSRVINVAGRQRMLSQRISKLALKLEQSKGDERAIKEELSKSLSLWQESHEDLQKRDKTGLQGTNSDEILEMFQVIAPHYQRMYQSASSLLIPYAGPNEIELHTAVVLANEAAFLEIMDRIVFQYDREARGKVASLKETEYYLFVVSLLIITLELLFVFRPLARNIRSTVSSLEASEQSSKKMANELTKLYDELGKSFQDLEEVNVKPESPSVYARMNIDGDFTYFSPGFAQVMEYSDLPPKSFKQLLTQANYQESFIDGLLDLLRDRQNWTGELRLVTEEGDFCWLEVFLIPTGQAGEVKMVARDITRFKEAKLRSRELNKERIEKSVKAQQYRSSLILEGQEEERKRLSRELHDGVGQMLSAMKLLLESFKFSSRPMQKRLDDAKDLMKSIIQEVRRVSFNLTPSSLEDFGLVAAVSKFCQEINHFTRAEVHFVNDTSFINRLESSIETNLYRIIQEAMNNAIKYAKASNITVRFSHTVNTLQIVIQDDGKGFDYAKISSDGHFEKAGHGIFNMRERTSYIGGDFHIISKPGDGTQVRIQLSLDKND